MLVDVATVTVFTCFTGWGAGEAGAGGGGTGAFDVGTSAGGGMEAGGGLEMAGLWRIGRGTWVTTTGWPCGVTTTF